MQLRSFSLGKWSCRQKAAGYLLLCYLMAKKFRNGNKVLEIICTLMSLIGFPLFALLMLLRS